MLKRVHLHTWFVYLGQTRRGEIRCGAGSATLPRITHTGSTEPGICWGHPRVTPLGYSLGCVFARGRWLFLRHPRMLKEGVLDSRQENCAAASARKETVAWAGVAPRWVRAAGGIALLPVQRGPLGTLPIPIRLRPGAQLAQAFPGGRAFPGPPGRVSPYAPPGGFGLDHRL